MRAAAEAGTGNIWFNAEGLAVLRSALIEHGYPISLMVVPVNFFDKLQESDPEEHASFTEFADFSEGRTGTCRLMGMEVIESRIHDNVVLVNHLGKALDYVSVHVARLAALREGRHHGS